MQPQAGYQTPYEHNHANPNHSAAQLSTSQVFGESATRQRVARVFQMSKSMNFVSFHNTEPRTRAYRHAQTNKESLEKQRLVERKGGYHKYEKIEAVTQYEQGTVGFMPEAGRFDTDTVGEEWRRRQAAQQRTQQIYQAKRGEAVAREERRWEQMEAAKVAEAEKYARYRDDPLMGKKNVGSMPFDPVTLRYNDGDDGARLAYEDERIRYRAALRAKNIHEKQNGCGFDTLTGGEMRKISTPAAPKLEANFAHAEQSHW